LKTASEHEVWNGAIHFIDCKGAASIDCIRILADLDNVVILDPLETCFGLNVFELPKALSQDEKAIAIEATLDAFLRMMQEFFGVSLDRMPRVIYIMTNCLRYLWRLSDSPTFFDMYQMLLAMRSPDEWRRLLTAIGLEEDEITESLEYVRELPTDARVAVMNKIEPFVKNQVLRRLFCVRHSTLDMDELLGPGKVVIWRVSVRGLEFMRNMIVSAILLRIWFTILQKAHATLGGKPPAVVLIIDEFQHAQHLEVLRTVLSESRGYNVCLALAHQDTHQVNETLLGSIFANTATQVLFRVNGVDAKRLAANLDPAKSREIVSTLTTQADFNALVRLRAKGAEEQLTPFQVHTLPKPAFLRPIEAVESFIHSMKARYAPRTVETESLFTSPQVRPWTQLLDEPLPHPLTFRILDAVEKLGQDAYVTKMAERLAIDRDLTSKRLEDLCTHGLLETYFLERDTRGRPPRVYSLTAEAEECLLAGDAASRKLRQSGIGGEEAVTLALRAIEYHRAKGDYVRIIPQGGTHTRPDLVAIPLKGLRSDLVSWDIDYAAAIEVESSIELTTHPEQVKFNMQKNVELGFARVEIWYPKEFSQILERLWRELEPGRRERVTLQRVWKVDLWNGP
jgi:DNA-binding MarR family transcriptional regulator